MRLCCSWSVLISRWSSMQISPKPLWNRLKVLYVPVQPSRPYSKGSQHFRFWLWGFEDFLNAWPHKALQGSETGMYKLAVNQLCDKKSSKYADIYITAFFNPKPLSPKALGSVNQWDYGVFCCCSHDVLSSFTPTALIFTDSGKFNFWSLQFVKEQL